MKKLLILLFSIFLLSSPSVFADDISDFSIEGISIGDSLLDYMTEGEILEEIELNKNDYSNLNEPNKYVEVYSPNRLDINLKTYDYLSFKLQNNSTNQYISNKNEKYSILSLRGLIRFIEDFDGCMQKRDEIAKVLSQMFPNTPKKEYSYSHNSDPSGKSIVDQIDFVYKSGDKATIYCVDYEETFRIKKNWSEGLTVSIKSVEIISWLTDY